MWIVHRSGYSCRWVDESEDYLLSKDEFFSDIHPELIPVPQEKSPNEKLTDLLVSEGVITKQKADSIK